MDVPANRIVVLGSSFAGLTAALEMRKRLGTAAGLVGADDLVTALDRAA